MLLEESKIFVIHAKQGYEYHEQRINQLFAKFGLTFEFVTDGDTSNFNDSLLNKYFQKDILDKYSKGAVSCTLNHMLALERLIASDKPYALIFENDPFFLGNFIQKIKKISKEVFELEKGFIVSLENTTLTFPSFFQIKRNKHLYRASKGRMAGAYIIDLEGAKRAISDLQSHKCKVIIDWWHNDLLTRNILKMYWVHPPLVEQGSHNGKMGGTISSKENNFLRRMAWLIQKGYKTTFRRLFSQSRLIDD